MRVDDLTVEVRDSTLTRQWQIDAPYLVDSFFAPRANGVGSWQLHLPAMVDGAPYPPAVALQEEGAGVIVTQADGDVFMSGSVEHRAFLQDADDPDGWWTFSGDPDDGLVDDALAYPDPSNTNPATQKRTSDPRSGKVEDLLYAYVDANIGPSAPTARKAGTFWDSITLGVNLHRGDSRSPDPGWSNLMALCQSLAAGTDLLFRVVQDGDGLVFEVREAVDLTADIVLDVQNNQLESAEQGSGVPTVTQAIVASSAGTVVAATDNDSAALWRRRRERYYTGSGGTTELQVQALQAVQQAQQDSFQVVPAEDLDVTSPAQLLGAKITAVMGDTPVVARVNQVVISVTTDGVTIAVALGDDDGTDWEGQVNRSIGSLTSRVSALERATTDSTGWVTDGLSITGDPANWTLVSYALTRRNGHVHGVVQVMYIGADKTADATTGVAPGNLGDIQNAFTLPAEWTSGNPLSEHLLAVRNGYPGFIARRTTGGRYDLVAGTFPGQVLANGTTLEFQVDHFAG